MQFRVKLYDQPNFSRESSMTDKIFDRMPASLFICSVPAHFVLKEAMPLTLELPMTTAYRITAAMYFVDSYTVMIGGECVREILFCSMFSSVSWLCCFIATCHHLASPLRNCRCAHFILPYLGSFAFASNVAIRGLSRPLIIA